MLFGIGTVLSSVLVFLDRVDQSTSLFEDYRIYLRLFDLYTVLSSPELDLSRKTAPRNQCVPVVVGFISP